MMHPPIKLLDTNDTLVQESGRPISTRASCGPCHDYDFISKNFHGSQGRFEIRSVIPEAGEVEGEEETRFPPFFLSPGMYGKWCSMPNRQVPPSGVSDVSDFDLGTPEWVRSCGLCHVGGVVSEFDRQGRQYDEVEDDEIAPMDPDYYYYSTGKNKLVRWDWKESGVVEMDCFLCHVEQFNRPARDEQLTEGWFAWAGTATLLGTGIVESDWGELVYREDAFNQDGTVKMELLGLDEPTIKNCGQCHGFATDDPNRHHIDPFFSNDLLRGTKKFGRIFHPGKIKDSDVNLAGKEAMDFPWDIHAAKKLVCIDCHFSPNNPAKMKRKTEAKHLRYIPQSNELQRYLHRPDHNFAKGDPCPENVARHLKNTMRLCSDCHKADEIHDWLPFRQVHYRALRCEVCHIPEKHYWAYKQIDLTLKGGGHAHARGVGEIGEHYKDLSEPVTGFRPAYMPKVTDGEFPSIIPFNPITSLYWYRPDKERPLYKREIRDAFWDRNQRGRYEYKPALLSLLDMDDNGKLDHDELRLDNKEKVAKAEEMLARAGVPEVELRLEIVPFSLHHNIVSKEQAIRRCTECHGPESRLLKWAEVFDFETEVAEAEMVSNCLWARHPEEYIHVDDGKFYFDPGGPLGRFYHIVGARHRRFIEIVGWLSVLGVFAGSLGHGCARGVIAQVRKRRNRKKAKQ